MARLRDPHALDDADDSAALGEGERYDAEASVVCPHCGEVNAIALDPGGGASQDYVEDCPVCCRPWRVRLAYDAAGGADVSLEPLDA